MGIEDTIKNITKIGVGVTPKKIKHHIALLIAAVNFGMARSEDVNDEVDACRKLIKSVSNASMQETLDYSGIGSNREFPEYAELIGGNKKNFISLGRRMYIDSSEIEILIMKKMFGIRAVAEYRYGKLSAVYVQFNKLFGKQIKVEGEHIKGISEHIDTSNISVVEVFGTLTMRYSEIEKRRYGNEKLISSTIIEQLKLKELGKLRFVAEFSDNLNERTSNGCERLKELGFEVAEYTKINTDMYELEDYLGEKASEALALDDSDELLDCLVVMFDSNESIRNALLTSDISFNKNIKALKVIGNVKNSEHRTLIKGMKLEQVGGEQVIKLLIEPCEFEDGDIVEEVEITLDDVYDLENSKYVLLNKIGEDFKIKKEN